MSEHDHHHDHSHHHGPTDGEFSETQKVLKRLHHWIHHNDDHAASYIDWAGRIESMGYPEAAQRLRTAAEMTHAISREFEAAATLVREQTRED